MCPEYDLMDPLSLVLIILTLDRYLKTRLVVSKLWGSVHPQYEKVKFHLDKWNGIGSACWVKVKLFLVGQDLFFLFYQSGLASIPLSTLSTHPFVFWAPLVCQVNRPLIGTCIQPSLSLPHFILLAVTSRLMPGNLLLAVHLCVPPPPPSSRWESHVYSCCFSATPASLFSVV